MGKKSKKNEQAVGSFAELLENSTAPQVAVMEPEEAPKPSRKRTRKPPVVLDQPAPEQVIPAAPVEVDLARGGAKLKPRSRKKKAEETPPVEEPNTEVKEDTPVEEKKEEQTPEQPQEKPLTIEWVTASVEKLDPEGRYNRRDWTDSEGRYRITRREELFGDREISFVAMMKSNFDGEGQASDPFDIYVKTEKDSVNRGYLFSRLMPAVLECEAHLAKLHSYSDPLGVPSNREAFIEAVLPYANGKAPSEKKAPNPENGEAPDKGRRGRKPKEQGEASTGNAPKPAVAVEGKSVSNKEKVYRAWIDNPQIEFEKALELCTPGEVKLGTIKSWIGSWKRGQNLPGCAK